MEEIKKFYVELAKNDEFKTKLAQFVQKNGKDYENIIEKLVLPQAKKMGYNFTKEDLLSHEKENGENGLSDEDLLNVSGGTGSFIQKVTGLALLLTAAIPMGTQATMASNAGPSYDTTSISMSYDSMKNQSSELETEYDSENLTPEEIKMRKDNIEKMLGKGVSDEEETEYNSENLTPEEIKMRKDNIEKMLGKDGSDEDTQATTSGTAHYVTYGQIVDQPIKHVVEEQMQQPQYASTLKEDAYAETSETDPLLQYYNNYYEATKNRYGFEDRKGTDQAAPVVKAEEDEEKTQATTPATVQYAVEETEKAPEIQHAERIQIEEEAPVLRAEKEDEKRTDQKAPVIQAEEDQNLHLDLFFDVESKYGNKDEKGTEQAAPVVQTEKEDDETPPPLPPRQSSKTSAHGDLMNQIQQGVKLKSVQDRIEKEKEEEQQSKDSQKKTFQQELSEKFKNVRADDEDIDEDDEDDDDFEPVGTTSPSHQDTQPTQVIQSGNQAEKAANLMGNALSATPKLSEQSLELALNNEKEQGKKDINDMLDNEDITKEKAEEAKAKIDRAKTPEEINRIMVDLFE